MFSNFKQFIERAQKAQKAIDAKIQVHRNHLHENDPDFVALDEKSVANLTVQGKS